MHRCRSADEFRQSHLCARVCADLTSGNPVAVSGVERDAMKIAGNGPPAAVAAVAHERGAEAPPGVVAGVAAGVEGELPDGDLGEDPCRLASGVVEEGG